MEGGGVDAPSPLMHLTPPPRLNKVKLEKKIWIISTVYCIVMSNFQGRVVYLIVLFLMEGAFHPRPAFLLLRIFYFKPHKKVGGRGGATIIELSLK